MICYDLFLAWFCSYDFDTVSVMILIWFQLWYLMWVKIVIWFSCKLRHLSFAHVVCCAPDWLAFRWGNANSSMVWAQLGKTQVHPHNRIKTVSKPHLNHIKTSYTLEKSTKSLSLGCFLHTWQTAGRQTDRQTDSSQTARQPDRQPDS